MNTKKVTKPERPGDEECCGGGCSPCVWDFYYDQLTLWNEQETKEKQGGSINVAAKKNGSS